MSQVPRSQGTLKPLPSSASPVTAYWSYALAPFGLLGMIMAGRKSKWGWLVSIGTQVLWLTYAVDTKQWGFIPGSLAYGFVYLRNFLKWNKQ